MRLFFACSFTLLFATKKWFINDFFIFNLVRKVMLELLVCRFFIYRRKFLVVAFVFLVSGQSHGQNYIEQIDECELFKLLKTFNENNLDNRDYKIVRDSLQLRFSLIRKIEPYVIVFADTVIAPILLEKNSDKGACPEYVFEYYEYIAKNIPKYDARDSVQYGKKINIKNLLINLCDLDNAVDNRYVNMLICEFKNPFTIEYLYNIIQKDYSNLQENDRTHNMSQQVMEENLKILSDRLNTLDERSYVYYKNNNSKSVPVKGFELYHENDFLLLIPKINQDREYTGGFRFNMITDFLKWRFFKHPLTNILTYQSVSILGGGYTPYIRYRNNFELADSLHMYDRPFSSYFCVERAKNIIGRDGLWRSHSEFQMGFMGISGGRKIQAKIHEDVVHKSQFVYGWDKQIANGGRFITQINQKFEFLLYSNTNNKMTILRPKTINVNLDKLINKYHGRNVICDLDLSAGTLSTSAGMGIRFSTLDLLKQSNNNMISCKKNYHGEEKGWKLEAGIKYRYVFHNSLLEGLGFFKTFDEDPYDKVSTDPLVIYPDKIERHQFILDVGFNIRLRKTTVFYKQTLQTLEYKSSLSTINFRNETLLSKVNPVDSDFYEEMITEQNKFLNMKFLGRQFYGFGAVGFSWIID